MIVQCQACQTRFRLADEKIKPEGTKVRCSKCKEIFTVMPPEPEPEPEPVDEAVDFDSFNMEAVNEDNSATPAEDTATDTEQESGSIEGPASAAGPSASDAAPEIDFSGLEEGMGSETDAGDDLADDFSFADTSQPAEESEAGEADSVDLDSAADEPDTRPANEPDFGAAFEVSEQPQDMELDFNEEQTPQAAEDESFAIESNATDAFDEQEDSGGDEPGEFAFDSDEEDSFSFDNDDPSPSESDEYSFDSDNPFDEDGTPDWGEDPDESDDSFNFEDPSFETETTQEKPAGGEEGGLQFGEIDFASDEGETDSDTKQSSDDFENATMQNELETESFAPQEQAAPSRSRDYNDEEPLPAPPPPKKSSLSRILLLLVLLLVVLGGATGFFLTQGGSVNLNMVTEYLPFLKDYIGEAQPVSPTDSIDINVSGSAYVNNQHVGQLLVIHGEAINKHADSRSSITIKGVLLDAREKPLLQQTVFCGNPLSDADLETMTFKDIEEAMNNEFGAGLSNMNVATDTSIPFTIVFRNLPEGIANINVEVVDSKPGAN